MGAEQATRLETTHRSSQSSPRRSREFGEKEPGRRFVLDVLIVQDNRDTLEGLGCLLQSHGHGITLARGGVEARALLSVRSFDVVLSDWQMPYVSGVDLCRIARAGGYKTYTYFIFLTCFGDKEHFIEAMRAGADDVLAKPCSIQEIDVRLTAAARVIGLHRRLEAQNASLRDDCQRQFNKARTEQL